MAPTARACRGLFVVVLVGALLTACVANGSGSSNGGAAPATAGTTATTTAPGRVPTVAAARLSGPITGGQYSPPAAMHAHDLAAAGYVEEEFFAAGTATSYAADGTLSVDGRWSVHPDQSAPYQTRLVVRRPADPAAFNGTVVVEWMNVSGGADSDPQFGYFGPEILRDGFAYVDVSAQALGINGGRGIVPGAPPSKGLKATDPDRYGSLVHPGDQFAFDIFSQVAAAIRSPGATPVLGPLRARHILATGQSQSAMQLTTYLDAVDPLAHAFDGYLVQSRFNVATALQPGAANTPPAGVKIRDDLGVPVLMYETETDVGPMVNFGPARQPDTGEIRTWEVAGTAHIDGYLSGTSSGCPNGPNLGPGHYVDDAAIHALAAWVANGLPPATATPLQLDTAQPTTVVRDEHGNAMGGVRTPSVDVPVAALSGQADPPGSFLCGLVGTTKPFDASTLTSLYHDQAGYLARFRTSLDRAIAGGFILAADRDAYLADAMRVSFPS
jgi:hypothetical protein